MRRLWGGAKRQLWGGAMRQLWVKRYGLRGDRKRTRGREEGKSERAGGKLFVAGLAEAGRAEGELWGARSARYGGNGEANKKQGRRSKLENGEGDAPRRRGGKGTGDENQWTEPESRYLNCLSTPSEVARNQMR